MFDRRKTTIVTRSNYCENCGAGIANEGYPCPECEFDPPPPSKSPILAAILSLLITGVGQIYAGRVGRGVAWFLGGITFGAVIGLTVPELRVIVLFVPVLSAIDAAIVAPTGPRPGTSPESGGAINQYACFDCGATFKSTETKETANCPECGGIPRPD
jgi:TM2 domain-containing membrane protein YozV/predicted Zn-ribbon and HTH transcriptional regulator